MLKIQTTDAKDYIDWVKLQMTLASAAIGSLVFNSSSFTSVDLKVATGLFFLSVIFNFASLAALIEHKNSKNSNVKNLSVFVILSGFACFAFALLAAVIDVIA